MGTSVRNWYIRKGDLASKLEKKKNQATLQNKLLWKATHQVFMFASIEVE